MRQRERQIDTQCYERAALSRNKVAMLRRVRSRSQANANTQSCARQPDGSMSCTDDHPHGFEWCINAAAVDHDGTVYANSEDGNAYAIASNGKLRESFFLDQALGAAYTPIALDHTGRVYALNNGHLSILGSK